MNPGPAQADMENTGTIGYREAREPKQDSKSICAVCGMPLASLELRSRVVTNTQIKCRVATCNSSTHVGCRDEKSELSTEWTCPLHSSTKVHKACVSDPHVETSASPLKVTSTRDTMLQLAGSGDHINEERSSENPPQRPKSDVEEGTPEETVTWTGTEDPTPGPSYLSANLMDLMEAIRLTQVKIESLTGDVRQVNQMLNEVISREAVKSVPHLHQSRSPPDQLTRSRSPPDQLTRSRSPAIPHRWGDPMILHPSPATADRPQPASAHAARRVSHGRHRVEGQHDSIQSILVIGDSNVQRLQTGDCDSNVTFHSVPGAATDNIARELNQSVESSSASDVILHVGTNDVTRMGSEVVAKNIFGLAQQARGQQGVRRVYICSVTPRKDRGSFIFSRSESVNSRLHSMCSKSNDVTFIDLRHQLDSCPFNGMARDALHYNRAGAAQVLRSIGDKVGSFLV